MMRVVLLQVVTGLDECLHAFETVCLIEGKVGLVGYAIGGCGIDNSLIKLEDGVVHVKHTFGHLLRVAVQTHAEKTLLLADLTDEFLSCHYYDLYGLLLYSNILNVIIRFLSFFRHSQPRSEHQSLPGCRHRGNPAGREWCSRYGDRSRGPVGNCRCESWRFGHR